jgi:predicted nucleotidyltransferase
MQAIAAALADHDRVAAALLFGSQATGRGGSSSDVDVAVLLHAQPAGAEKYDVVRSILASLTSRIAGEKLDLIVLNDAPPVLAFQVLQHGRVVVCRDPVALHRFRVRTYDLHADFAPVEELFRKATRQRALRGRGDG